MRTYIKNSQVAYYVEMLDWGNTAWTDGIELLPLDSNLGWRVPKFTGHKLSPKTLISDQHRPANWSVVDSYLENDLLELVHSCGQIELAIEAITLCDECTLDDFKHSTPKGVAELKACQNIVGTFYLEFEN